LPVGPVLAVLFCLHDHLAKPQRMVVQAEEFAHKAHQTIRSSPRASRNCDKSNKSGPRKLPGVGEEKRDPVPDSRLDADASHASAAILGARADGASPDLEVGQHSHSLTAAVLAAAVARDASKGLSVLENKRVIGEHALVNAGA